MLLECIVITFLLFVYPVSIALFFFMHGIVTAMPRADIIIILFLCYTHHLHTRTQQCRGVTIQSSWCSPLFDQRVFIISPCTSTCTVVWRNHCWRSSIPNWILMTPNSPIYLNFCCHTSAMDTVGLSLIVLIDWFNLIGWQCILLWHHTGLGPLTVLSGCKKTAYTNLILSEEFQCQL